MPDGTYALRVRFSANRYSLAIRQEVCAMMALNMLRRWLNGEDIISEHGWIAWPSHPYILINSSQSIISG
ncbi:molybdopterin-binding protein [Salmonella enterica]|nr:molybdopterin-binding protein [Salmonella enterica]